MAGKEDTKHVPDLAFVPVGTVVYGDSGLDGGDLIGISLDADTRLVGDGKEVVDDLVLAELNCLKMRRRNCTGGANAAV